MEVFLGYFKEWKEEFNGLAISKSQRKKCTLSQETLDGLEITGIQWFSYVHTYVHDVHYFFVITVRSFCELCPLLIKTTGKYILSEVFWQDLLERYFHGSDIGEEAMRTLLSISSEPTHSC